jgi:hypothetical protein
MEGQTEQALLIAGIPYDRLDVHKKASFEHSRRQIENANRPALLDDEQAVVGTVWTVGWGSDMDGAGKSRRDEHRGQVPDEVGLAGPVEVRHVGDSATVRWHRRLRRGRRNDGESDDNCRCQSRQHR